ncbi:hypothetical protein A2853_03185 [Candidatus Kaiserbacteria bacterium RIFCSPHIGHO2_01_FULL_55_17]|uniref:Glycosyltransferase 2-like domain-containing protein n=1 Tax=Candidatus Kaiserbacteria bacterium RIFCSPHIGHO2_01_FULL_55_17 TaxID=1798484 RepID=A0A1F6D8Y8_9BACT|nr:MAG: hypothetical protein A2853_03185 [Candidatus Kaiserbacteria bacterium RIFCSPHIGHO2_01_FULL_55_17]
MISIIIPARDEEKLIVGAISQFKALMMPHEIIVSDDGSKDKTVEIARSLADKVVTFDGDKHAIGRARNAGVEASRGDVLVFIDSDSTIPDPQAFFSHALARFEKEEKLLGLACPQLVHPGIETWSDRFVFGLDNFFNWVFNNVLRHGAGSGKCIIVRRSAFERVHGFREDLIFREDCDLLKRISKFGRTHFDTRLTVYHSGRRLHRLGIFRFYYTWILNGLYVVFADRARDKEWTPVR